MTGRRVRGRRWRAACLLLAVVAAAPAGAQEDQPAPIPLGEGFTLAKGLWIAGDVTFGAEVPRAEAAQFELDDVSLLARWEPAPRFALFTELRVEGLLEVVEGEGPSTGDATVGFERLWAEALVTPSFTVRIGKAFTPFGLWNQTHRAPLTWAVEEPAVADELFPIHTTGLSLIYRGAWRGWSLDATVYGPAQDAIRLDDEANEEKGWLTGTRVAAGRTFGGTYAAIGLNAAGFRRYDRRAWATATGLDLEVNAGGHQLTGELTFRIPVAGGRTVQGLYLQDAIPLAPLGPLARDLYGVLRFEVFQPAVGGAAVGGLVGLFWRPVPFLVLRTDYLFATRTLERLTPGLHASISLLF